jgi:hypothetical protein
MAKNMPATNHPKPTIYFGASAQPIRTEHDFEIPSANDAKTKPKNINKQTIRKM